MISKKASSVTLASENRIYYGISYISLDSISFSFLLTFPKWVAERKQEGPTTRSRWKAVKWVVGGEEVDAPY